MLYKELIKNKHSIAEVLSILDESFIFHLNQLIFFSLAKLINNNFIAVLVIIQLKIVKL